MEMTSCEYFQSDSPQDWTRSRKEFSIIKSIQKIENLRWLPSSMDLKIQTLMN
jgi:hypothetical protein